MKLLTITFSCLTLLATAACAPKQSLSHYKESEIGISRAIEYGTITAVREVEIEGKTSGAGTLLGAGVGAGAGSYAGSGSGNAWATAGAAVIGAVAGTVAERAMNDRTAFEYTVTLQSGDTKTIVQEKEDGALKPGQHVMLQYCDGGSDYLQKCKKDVDSKEKYQRLIPVKKLPPYVKKRRKIIKG